MGYADQINDFRNGFRTMDARRDPRFDPYKTTHDENLGEAVAEGNTGEVAKSVAGTAGEVVGGVGGAVAGGLVGGPVGAVAGATLGASAGESVGKEAVSAVSGEDGTALEEKNAAILRGEDASMSWGRAGATETSTERGAPTIPAPALQSMGIAPADVSQTSPTPKNLGTELKPDANRNESWNAEQIFSGTRIGG